MKHFYIFFVFLCTSAMFSQDDAWVYFNSKPNSQTYLSNPLEMLSQRALTRRANQNIPLNFTDVPIEKTYIDQIKSSSGITIMARSKWSNVLHIQGAQAAILALKNLSFVDKVVFADRTLNTTLKKKDCKRYFSVLKLIITLRI